MNRHLLATAAILLLLSAPMFAKGNEQRIAWDDLQRIVGKKVRVVMPDGTRIEGKAIAVEPDALTLQVKKTTNKAAFAKGKLLVPRAALRTFDISHPTYYWRVGGSFVGFCLGFFLMDTAMENKGTIDKAIFYPAGGGVMALGYVLGNALDRRVTTYVVAK